MNKLPYLNLGCGSTYNAAWTNVDFISTGKDVIACNLLAGIPLSDNSFEAVYHSHVLEHFPKDKALFFIKECYRVLKKDGTIRVAIPDLEQIALNYIKYLKEAVDKVPKADVKYEWTMLEMYDQVVRSKSGGEMIDYIKDAAKDNDDFLLQRNGKEAQLLIDHIRGPASASPQKSILNRVLNKIKRVIAAGDSEAMKISKFRSQGEIHQWMYDRYSLGKLLESAGFKTPQVKSAFESNISDWSSFELDGKEGKVRKPDSLFMEAVK
jgi:predicted SAM-dependent methyltransferase